MIGLILYNLLFLLAFLLSIPFFVFKMIKYGKYRAGILQRFGFYPKQFRMFLSDKKTIWLHAVSVGEVMSVLPFIEGLEKQYPSNQIVVSTTTLSGNLIARKKISRKIPVFYFPLDFFWSVSRSLKVVHPSVIILTETEIWPNFLSAAFNRSIPVALINARVSEKAYIRYRFIKWLVSPLLSRIDIITAQTTEDVNRLKFLGARPARLKLTGNLKYETALLQASSSDEIENYRNLMGFSDKDLVWVCGSTHEGEESILVEIWERLRKVFPSLRLIIAPRHPERWKKVEVLIRQKGLPCIKRSVLKGKALVPLDVILLDTMGELSKIYALASIVFVGKSLLHNGGQNILEPASLGKPVLFGPHMENFKDISDLFLSLGAVIQVQDSVDLEKTMIRLIQNTKECNAIGKKSKDIVQANQGATRKTLSLLREIYFQSK